MKTIDLFCGCGGISAGLRSAGAQIIAGADIEKKYMATFRHNFPEALAFEKDISQVKPDQFMELAGIKAGELDILAGGPPCQGFSKNVPRKLRSIDSSNNTLIRTYIEYCSALRPKVFLMENVAEMKNGFDQTYTDEIIGQLSAAGYNVTYGVLNAADYGVPQRRRRAFFLGVLDKNINPSLPTPTHGANNSNDLFSLPKHVTVWDAIGDLPKVDHGEGCDPTEYTVEAFSPYQKMMRSNATHVRNHIARRLKPLQFERLSALRPGEGLKDLPAHLQTKGGYSGAYGRLTKDMIAPTITRWVFHPGSGRWGHPVTPRVLTMREVARVQGFEDNFEFVGTYNDQAGQLGNAVPALLARAIGNKIKSYL